MSEDDDFFNFVDLSKKKYFSDEARENMSVRRKRAFEQGTVKVHNRVSKTEWLKRFKSTHGDRYDYSKFQSPKNQNLKVIIVCPEHGEFLQRSKEHANGSGCPLCFGNVGRTKTTKQIIQEFKDIHGDKFDYSKVEYKNRRTKVLIICPEHGEFFQSPNQHANGSGCPICSRLKSSDKKSLSLDEVLLRFRSVHGEKYDYSKIIYKSNKTKITITCPEHGDFTQLPYAHAKGQRCPMCAVRQKHDG